MAAPAFRKIKAKRKAAKSAQLGKGLGSNLVKADFDLGTKALSSEFGKKLINKGIDNIPNIFKFGVSKNEAQNRVQNKHTSLFD